MAHILTVTVNPAIDISTSVDKVEPGRKLRCGEARRDPGGGGINVARVANRLGADTTALYAGGGSCGKLLKKLVDRENLRSAAIQIAEETREDFTVIEASTAKEFRFVSLGPHLKESEWRHFLDALNSFPDPIDYLVASGSLPPGVPEDFYASIAKLAKARGVPLALDTSGLPLKAALEHGVDLIKPNIREMRELIGEPLADVETCVAASTAIAATGKAKLIALTLGSKGAILITREAAWRAGALPIKPVSTVGAGDSFLGAMVWALASGMPELEAFRQGVAAGSAALLVHGTELAHSSDIQALVNRVEVVQVT
ncbi:MAG TPA: 1-phosphofructokinase family hexose kinase [Hyphomicrobiales bacterium]|nr:1-phosphofructokinase family hexose kinase [Hyphomicrobiales bacterium]